MKANRKDETMRIRINKKEKELLQQISASSNLTLSAFVLQKTTCTDTISKSEIPNLIQTWVILNKLCNKIEKSDNESLKTYMKNLIKRGTRQ